MAIYKKCSPDAFAATVYEIKVEEIKAQGIKALIFDLDNTLIPYNQPELGDQEIQFLSKMQEDFKCLILSNSGRKRVEYALRRIDVPAVSRAMKPLKKGFNKALSILNVKREEVMVIGDQLMTDVYGSKRFGFKITLVLPIQEKTEKWTTRFNRKLERKMLKKIKKKNPALYEERLMVYANR
ncbi:MAG: YqeG family HAD IIIA-type phosphatase [Acholeplasmataceae bacterium]